MPISITQDPTPLHDPSMNELPPTKPTSTSGTAASGGVTVDPATIQKLEADIKHLMSQIQAVTANLSKLDPPAGGEPGVEGHVNKMLIAQFPIIAFAMMELARNLMEMSFSMSQFSIELTDITYDLGVQMANLQEALTKAQMVATQGDIIKECVGIGAGFAMITSGPLMRSSIESRYAKQNNELEMQKGPLNTKMAQIDQELNPGSMGQNITLKKDPLTSLNTDLSKTQAQLDDVNNQLSNPRLSSSQRTTLENQKADLNSQKTNIEKDIKFQTDLKKFDDDINSLTDQLNARPSIAPEKAQQLQQDKSQLISQKEQLLRGEKITTQKGLNDIDAKQKALGDAKQNELSMLGPNIQIGSQMLTQLGNLVGAAMTLVSQQATIAPAKAMKVLEQVQTLLGNMLQTMQSNRGDYESMLMLNSVLQQLNSWVGAMAAIKYSRQ